MAFINLQDREDMQDSTFKIVAGLIAAAIEAKSGKDLKTYLNWVEDLYDLSYRRIEDKEAITQELERINNIIYKEGPKNEKELSKALDDVRNIYRRILADLDNAGLLFRAQANLDELYKRGGRG